MQYGKIVQGRFSKRLNRFVAEVWIDGKLEKVHVKNTGRLKELLLEDAPVLLEWSDNPNRKTRYSLVAVEKQGNWVNIDSQAPNTIAYEALMNGKIAPIRVVDTLKREVTFGESRFDLYFEQGEDKGFIEVKGVTLEKNGTAMFPDAPTTRGTKHIEEMIKAVQAGFRGTILFVIQIEGCQRFIPYWENDPPFAAALAKAAKSGVQVLAYDTIIKENELVLNKQIRVDLDYNKGVDVIEQK